MATKQKPTKAEISQATDAGMEARQLWNPGDEMPKCEYETGPLLTAWENGWRGQDEFEKKALGPNTDADIAEELAPSVNEAGIKQLESHGHNVTDPDVELARDDLANLMTEFDNHGVQIVEEQWRKLSDNEQAVAAMWANNRRTGGTRPVPECLMPFASDRLKQEFVDHVEEQEEFRTSLLSCEIGKPSRSKLNEDGQYRVNLKFRIPLDQVQPGRALEMWGDVRSKVEFGERSTLDWKPDRLPGMDDAAGEVFECEADVLKYVWTKTGWAFGFSVSQEVISIDEANDLWDGTRGSIKITPIGRPEKTEKEVEEETTAEMIAKVSPKPSGKSLFDDGKNEVGEITSNQKMNLDGEFISPDEYMVPIHAKGCSAIISVGVADGRYFAAGEAIFRDSDDESIDAGWGIPRKTSDGCASLTLAVQKQIGTMIKWAMQQNAVADFLKDLRSELKRLEDGGEPHMMPE